MTTANKITIVRIILVPIFMFFLLEGSSSGNYIALIIFAIAALTDGVDGYVARKYNQVTNFGKFMDPLADKLLIASALFALVQLGKMSAWPAMIIIAREFIITSLRIVAVSDGKIIAASFWGKVKTVVQIGAVITILLFSENNIMYGINIADCMSWIMALITVYSGIDYMIKNRDVLSDGTK